MLAPSFARGAESSRWGSRSWQMSSPATVSPLTPGPHPPLHLIIILHASQAASHYCYCHLLSVNHAPYCGPCMLQLASLGVGALFSLKHTCAIDPWVLLCCDAYPCFTVGAVCRHPRQGPTHWHVCMHACTQAPRPSAPGRTTCCRRWGSAGDLGDRHVSASRQAPPPNPSPSIGPPSPLSPDPPPAVPHTLPPAPPTQVGLGRIYGTAVSAPPSNPYAKLKQAIDRRLYK